MNVLFRIRSIDFPPTRNPDNIKNMRTASCPKRVDAKKAKIGMVCWFVGKDPKSTKKAPLKWHASTAKAARNRIKSIQDK